MQGCATIAEGRAGGGGQSWGMRPGGGARGRGKDRGSRFLLLREGPSEDSARGVAWPPCRVVGGLGAERPGWQQGPVRRGRAAASAVGLGVLATLPAETNTIVADLAEVDDFLSAQKGYGLFGLDRKQRLMHAGMIVTSDYLKNDRTMSTAAIHGTISLIAAQQAAMCAAIAASSAAASSSSGGN